MSLLEGQLVAKVISSGSLSSEDGERAQRSIGIGMLLNRAGSIASVLSQE